ncbi:hypothetical protein T01_572 [Trichinella spiralis]|uniref:Uncharacterized protein n=1 Tax=Trichinella spiralis TaxID=6334 RepID=A0A0V1AK76_TRISP|nr:hypothetical protein T01_572 [Trichinella spiralis]
MATSETIYSTRTGLFAPYITKKPKFVSKAYFRKLQKQQRL